MLTGGALFLVFAMDVKRGRKLSKFAIMSKGEFVGQDVAILSNFAAQLYYTVYYTVSDVPQYACWSHCYTLLHLQESLYSKAHIVAMGQMSPNTYIN